MSTTSDFNFFDDINNLKQKQIDNINDITNYNIKLTNLNQIDIKDTYLFLQNDNNISVTKKNIKELEINNEYIDKQIHELPIKHFQLFIARYRDFIQKKEDQIEFNKKIIKYSKALLGFSSFLFIFISFKIKYRK